MWTHFMTSMVRRVSRSDSQLKRVDLGTPRCLEIERRLQPLARKWRKAVLISAELTTDFTDFTDGADSDEEDGRMGELEEVSESPPAVLPDGQKLSSPGFTPEVAEALRTQSWEAESPPSPWPNGFPSPPLDGCPELNDRSAVGGPPGEGIAIGAVGCS